MRTLLFVCCGLVPSALVAPPACAEDSDAKRLAEAVAPYVDAQTLFIAHIDLRAFDGVKSIASLAELAQLSDRTRNQLQADATPINVLTGGLPEGSTADVFIVVSIADVARLPLFFLMPLAGNTPARPVAPELRRAIAKSLHVQFKSEEIAGSLVTAHPATLERLKKAQATPRPEIAAAFEAAGTSALQLLFIPSIEIRRLIEQLLPTLPADLGGVPTKTFTQGVAWGVAGVELAPKKTAVHVVIQSADAEAAATLERELPAAIAALGKLDQVRQTIPMFDERALELVPKASGDRLTLDLTEENGGLKAVAEVLAPLAGGIYSRFLSR
ncbi:MAG: hypothetical protein HYX69_22955 [Planctomycetia bacterium]|nr:hypothetical protein [Planctomycetia bacterium]